MLLNKAQIADGIQRALVAFANEPQNGERLQGMSPVEAWRAFRSDRPAMVLPESLRYFLATNRSEQTVTHEGIKLRVGSEINYYRGSAVLGALRGKKLQVFFDPELPEHVIVIDRTADPRGENPFSVPRAERVPANTATKADFASASRDRKAFASYGRAVYRTIVPRDNATVRNERLGSEELRETGNRIAAVQRQATEKDRAKERKQTEVRRELHDLVTRLQAKEAAKASGSPDNEFLAP
jgi:hypothetical protein